MSIDFTSDRPHAPTPKQSKNSGSILFRSLLNYLTPIITADIINIRRIAKLNIFLQDAHAKYKFYNPYGIFVCCENKIAIF